MNKEHYMDYNGGGICKWRWKQKGPDCTFEPIGTFYGWFSFNGDYALVNYSNDENTPHLVKADDIELEVMEWKPFHEMYL